MCVCVCVCVCVYVCAPYVCLCVFVRAVRERETRKRNMRKTCKTTFSKFFQKTFLRPARLIVKNAVYYYRVVERQTQSPTSSVSPT